MQTQNSELSISKIFLIIQRRAKRYNFRRERKLRQKHETERKMRMCDLLTSELGLLFYLHICIFFLSFLRHKYVERLTTNARCCPQRRDPPIEPVNVQLV